MRAARASLLAALLALAPAVHAEGKADLVGTWYGEILQGGMRGQVKYDAYRTLSHNRPDGTKTIVFRYYDAGKVVQQSNAVLLWGLEGGKYWTVCVEFVFEEMVAPCSGRQEYDVLSLTPEEMRYRSTGSGIEYKAIRVKDDFQLP